MEERRREEASERGGAVERGREPGDTALAGGAVGRQSHARTCGSVGSPEAGKCVGVPGGRGRQCKRVWINSGGCCPPAG